MSMSGVDSAGGGKRKKLAGYLKAANDLRQSYQQSYSEKWGSQNGDFEDDELGGIPGAFPDVAIVSHGDEQLVLFPSYARRHIKEPPNPEVPRIDSQGDGYEDAEYWAREWQKFEDDRAVVDVDVRGWLYSPHRGPLNRKNRLLIGLARQLSGIPAPKSTAIESSSDPHSLRARHREHEERREQEKIAEEAEQILRKGKGEEDVAARGGYSEKSKVESDSESIYNSPRRATPLNEAPGPGHLPKRFSWNQPADMSQTELLTANANLLARLKPFLTNPLTEIPITVFFYDEENSVSRTVTTNEAGHFTMRAALDFIPTHVRILASEHLSAIEEVKITEPKGVSIISDVDDTIKHSSIGSGAKEIFRNAFIRDLGDLSIDGVKEWYNTMYDMGVGVHYVSNSPWQLFPVLVSFFRQAGLPPGSYHLKQYSGMLQGIFEPVAERKKGTLEKIMKDFPERKFILIGDSGEADLEVYTDIVLANPKKVLAIFIRDVTTPPNKGFFDSAMGPLSSERDRAWASSKDLNEFNTNAEVRSQRPEVAPRGVSEAVLQTSSGPTMGNLIDFDSEPEESVHQSHRKVLPRSVTDLGPTDIPARKSLPDINGRAAPPRPTKPLALRGVNVAKSDTSLVASGRGAAPPPPPPRRSNAPSSHPLSKSQSIVDLGNPEGSYVASARSKVASAYNSLPEVRSYIPGVSGYNSPRPKPSHNTSSYSTSDEAPPPPAPRQAATASSSGTPQRMSWNDYDSSSDESFTASSSPAVPANKKLDLWKRRWKRAKDILEAQDVVLRSWRVGEDVSLEAVQMVEKAMRQMGVEGYGKGKGEDNHKTGEGGGEMKVKDMKR